MTVYVKPSKKIKILLAALAALFLLAGSVFGPAAVVRADMGPKPSVTVKVEHVPEGATYYLDLLIHSDTPPYAEDSNLYDEERNSLDPEMLAVLEAYGEDGWYPALVRGTGAPLWGDLTGRASGSDRSHTFGYFGVPDRFKIIIVNDQLEATVSEEIERTAFDFTVIYDYETGAVRTPPVTLSILSSLPITLPATLILEGLLLLLFRYRLKDNWKPFLIVNVATQLLLTVVLGLILLYSGGLAVLFLYIPFEGGILIVEAVLFIKFLKPKRPGRSAVYAIVANLVSFLVGFFYYVATGM